jgi:hypothetical protein
MSWFALHTPPGVRLVPFFITARWAGQSDRVAFTDVMIEQLAELLDEPMPEHLTDATRDQCFLDLAVRAAEACASRGERLVMLVDGLDEDRGVTTGPDAYSIAALLPARPAAGMRIIVSGRLNPPIPSEVPDGHPLRDPAIARFLTRSERAEVVRHEMLHELARMLQGSAIEQDLLGLVTAAQGGLGIKDLAELTELPEWQVQEQLTTVTGRTFIPTPSLWQANRETEVYVLGHEELQLAACERLGTARLEAYRQRMHQWADGYREQRWPPDTPEYLLRGYFQLLRDARDLPRMLTYSTDKFRHTRMFHFTGGDGAALAEITATQNAFVALESPDVTAVARLAVHYDALGSRNAEIPAGLAAVWAQVGHPARAHDLTRSMTDPGARASALIAAVEAVAKVGDTAAADALIDDAESTARALGVPERKAYTLAAVARAAAAVGKIDRAMALTNDAEFTARTIADADQHVRAMIGIAGAAASMGALDRAVAIAQSIQHPELQANAFTAAAQAAAASHCADQAETLAHAILIPDRKAWAIAAVSQALAHAGCAGRASALADQAEALTSDFTNSEWRACALALFSDAAAASGDTRRAHDLALAARAAVPANVHSAWTLTAVAHALATVGEINQAVGATRSIFGTPNEKANALAAVVQGAVRAGSPDQAEEMASNVTSDGSRAQIMTAVAQAVANAHDMERAIAICHRIEETARSSANNKQEATMLTDLAVAIAESGNLDRAETLARSIREPDQQASALARLAHAAASISTEQALAIAHSISQADERSLALAGVAVAVASAGDKARGVMLANESQTLASPLSELDNGLRIPWLVTVVQALAIADVPQRACDLMAGWANATMREFVLSCAARAVASKGYLRQAQILAGAIEAPGFQAYTYAQIAEVLARRGHPDEARNIAESITHPASDALASTARALAALGDQASALAAAARAEESARGYIREVDQSFALSDVARATAIAGNINRAHLIARDAEALARLISGKFKQQNALRSAMHAIAAVASEAARAGDPERAEEIAHTISGSAEHAQAVASVAQAVAAYDATRGIAIAQSITDPVQEAKALAAIAAITPAPQALILTAQAIRVTGWHPCLTTLAVVHPPTLTAIANEIASLNVPG